MVQMPYVTYGERHVHKNGTMNDCQAFLGTKDMHNTRDTLLPSVYGCHSRSTLIHTWGTPLGLQNHCVKPKTGLEGFSLLVKAQEQSLERLSLQARSTAQCMTMAPCHSLAAAQVRPACLHPTAGVTPTACCTP